MANPSKTHLTVDGRRVCDKRYAKYNEKTVNAWKATGTREISMFESARAKLDTVTCKKCKASKTFKALDI